jgi:MFS transporter, ACS family, hexuronate transporter
MAQPRLSDDDVAALPKPATAWAWGICWLMFASTMLNYMDRQTMALVSDPIKKEFSLSNTDFGWVLTVFQLTYAVFQVPAGYLVDRWNVRWAYAGAVAWWSLAGMAAAFSPGLGMLLMFRALLGVGESFNWPCALRVTATVLPPQDRSLGNGIFNSGAAIGAVVTPLVVTPLTALYGWRTAFLVVGALGFAWVGIWLAVAGGEHRRLFAGRSAAKPEPDDLLAAPGSPGLSGLAKLVFGGVLLTSALVAATAVRVGLAAIWWGVALLMVGLLVAALVVPLHALKGVDWARSLGEVVRLRRFWVLVVVSVSINVCWHFLINWLPTYLKEDRKLTYLASGLLSSLPFVAADVGNLGGGVLSRVLANRTAMSPTRARATVMGLCTLLITSGAWVGVVRSDTVVLVLLGLMAMATAAFMANYFAFTQEVSARHTGLIVGILGGLGNLYAAGFHPVAGRVKDITGSFGPIFVVVGLLPFVGLGALLLGWGRGSPRVEAEPG